MECKCVASNVKCGDLREWVLSSSERRCVLVTLMLSECGGRAERAGQKASLLLATVTVTNLTALLSGVAGTGSVRLGVGYILHRGGWVKGYNIVARFSIFNIYSNVPTQGVPSGILQIFVSVISLLSFTAFAFGVDIMFCCWYHAVMLIQCCNNNADLKRHIGCDRRGCCGKTKICPWTYLAHRYPESHK